MSKFYTENPILLCFAQLLSKQHANSNLTCVSHLEKQVICVISSVRLAPQPDHKYTLSQIHKHLEVLPLTMFWKAICVSNSTPESLVFTKGRHNKLYNEVKRGEMVGVWILHTAFLKWSKPLDTLVWSFIFYMRGDLWNKQPSIGTIYYGIG